jgi:hypothetical protein
LYKVRRVTEHHKAMRKARRNPELVVILGTQLRTHPLAKSGRAAANIHGHIKHRTGDHTHQLALGMGRQLIVQPAQHALAAAAVVVLNELVVRACGLVEEVLAKAFQKKPRSSRKSWV